MSETKGNNQTTVGRRSFLRTVGLGAGAAGAAAALAAGTASAEIGVQAGDPSGKSDAGYRKSEHVRRYYDLARF